MFRTGYILDRRQDLFWFLGLPFLAIGTALVSWHWLPAAALGGFNLWITVPHHFASWLRTYGLAEDRSRFKDRLILGPVIIVILAVAGLRWAPITTALLVILWDHQHSLMQQHGFARIYDFRAKTGGPGTGRFDLALHIVLFGNMLLASPLFLPYLLRELYRLHIPVSSSTVQIVQTGSWSITAIWLVVYGIHVIRSVKQGHFCNPVKYAFIAVSYFLWYFCAWHSANLLVFGIAHRIMHGCQYIVMVYWYLRRKSADQPKSFASSLVRPGSVFVFIGVGLVYAAAYQLFIGHPLGEFGFGVVPFTGRYQAIPALGLPGMTQDESYALLTSALVNAVALVHYYFDSFIWKVSDRRTQGGLT